MMRMRGVYSALNIRMAAWCSDGGVYPDCSRANVYERIASILISISVMVDGQTDRRADGGEVL
jgi:hypothetical protein